jgi:arabinofuranosyltransferase
VSSDLAAITERYVELLAAQWWVVACLAAGGALWWLTRRNRLLSWMILPIALAVGLACTWRQRSLVDDAFITFRYAEHFVAGQGAVYNPGEWVQGYTNFLWMLLLAACHALTGRPTPEIALVLGPLVYVALVLATAAVGRAMQEQGSWAPIAAAWVAVQYSTTAFATTGMEGNFAALWVVLGAWAFVSRADPLGAWLAGMAWILATLTRPDHAIFYVVGAAVIGWRHRRDPELLAYLGAYVAPIVVWILWALWATVTYGSWVPNTFHTKVSGDWYWSQGAAYAWASLLGGQLLWPLLLSMGWVATGLRSRRDGWLAAWMFPCLALFQIYLLRIGGDFMLGRFYLSLTPLLAIGAERFVFTGPRSWGLAGVIVLAASARGVSVVRDYHREWNMTDESTVYRVVAFDPVRVDHSNWDHGHQLRKVLTDRGIMPVIATSGIGMLGYYSGATVLDVRGLTDETVAQSELARRGLPGHEKKASVEYMVSRDVRFLRAKQPDPALARCLGIRFGGPSRDHWIQLTWDEALMDTIAERSPEVTFERPEVCLDRYVSTILPTRDAAQVERDLATFDRWYFDRYGPGRWRDTIARRLAALERN